MSRMHSDKSRNLICEFALKEMKKKKKQHNFPVHTSGIVLTENNWKWRRIIGRWEREISTGNTTFSFTQEKKCLEKIELDPVKIMAV